MADQDDDLPLEGESVELEEDNIEVEDTEDGGAIIRLGNEIDAEKNGQHFENIVEDVDRSELSGIVNDLLDKIEHDKEAREKRDKLYEEGLRRTGLGDDAPGGANFTGSSRVVHPMLIKSCVDFSARVMKEVFPANGPVRAKVLGKQDGDKMDKAQRKTDFMNWQCTEQIPEFRTELEQLTTQLPLGGSQYLKFKYDRKLKRAVPIFVPIDDMILPFAATNFYTADRRTHRLYVTKREYAEAVKYGEYADVDLSYPQDPEYSRASRANDKIEGKTPDAYNDDGVREMFEVTTFLDIEDGVGVAPYIITIDKSSQRAVSLFRNWEPDDEAKKDIQHTVEFSFVPWRGAYAIGLTHMIGGLSAAATGALRALMDAAHINNIPGMLKLKGGAQGQTLNVQPTQVVEIEGSGMIDDIRKLAMPLPFNPPSPVLYQLLGFLVEEGGSVVQTTFEKLADNNPNAPVGTTMALIEQGMVVFSSIHSRIHNSLSMCLKILHRINSAYLTEEDVQGLESGLDVRPEDFDGPMDVIPVSDPSIFSDTQRFAQTQALQQRAGALPQMYDARKVEERFLRTMKIDPEDVLQPLQGKEDIDPVSENVAATMGQPVYVLPEQDHIEHMKIHLAFLQSPLFGQNPAIIKTFLWPMAQHLRDHLLQFYMAEAHGAVRKAAENGIELTDASQQAQLVIMTQQAIDQQLQAFAQQLAQIDAAAQQYAPQPQLPPDSSLQVAQMRMQSDQQKLKLQAQADQQATALRAQELQIDAQQSAAQLAQQAQLVQLQEQNKMILEQLRQQAEDRRKAEELSTRERMNTADNETAMRLAAAEIATGEKVAVSTGTGIDPNP